MNTLHFPKLILSSSIAVLLAACGGGGGDNASGSSGSSPTGTSPAADGSSSTGTSPAADGSPSTATATGDILALTSTNRIISFNRNAPGTIRSSVAITGLQSGDTLIGIDYRPADGNLYGVAGTGRIYTINADTGAATLRSTLTADAADATAPFTQLSGTDFGVDFNPVADRLRIVSDTGQNLRINVDTGATTTDGTINGGAANAAVTASAYTNSFSATGTTTLFAIDSASDVLYTQNPPNDGTLSSPVSLGIDASGVSGFDIDALNNTGYGVFTSGGARTLYSINLAATSNPATSLGTIAVADDIRGLAIRPPQGPIVYGLADDGRLISFKPLTPNTVDSSVTITGIGSGENLLGIDFRPKDGALYGITSAGRILTIDPVTGAATPKATLAPDASDATSPYTAIAGTDFAVDFNPVADRLRVVSDTGQNLRINVDTGATTTDGTINQAGATPLVTAAAYTNSFDGTSSTMLFDIDNNSDNLALQNPPNDGTLINVGALGVDAVGNVGMDIAGGANGLVLGALRASAGGATSIYRINLTSGAASLINGTTNPALSLVGNGAVSLRDVAISLK